MNPTDIPKAAPDVVLRVEFDDWALLFQPSTGEAVGINPIGVAIWELLDSQHTLAMIAAQIEQQFEDTPDTVLDDTIEFMDDLHRRLFVVVE